MDAIAKRTAQAAVRAEKKAARRAAFIQDIVIGVRNDLYPGYQGPPDANESFEHAYDAHMKQLDAERYAARRQPGIDAQVLYWAKKQGLLPLDAISLPDLSVQQELLKQAKKKGFTYRA